MNKIKLKFTKDKLIFHIIQKFLGSNGFEIKRREYFFINNINYNWKLFFKKKYSFFNEGDKYTETISYYDSEKSGKQYIINESFEKNNEEIEQYIYRDLEGQELVDIMAFLYHEIFSLEILPGNPKTFGDDYWGNNTDLFHNIVGQIDYKKLKVSEIEQLIDIIKKNYKRSKISIDNYNEVLRKLEWQKEMAVNG